MGNWVNWLLVIAGIICVIIELALGALTGFDLALVGASLAAGGGIGLLTGSVNIGMLSAAGAALLYFALFRKSAPDASAPPASGPPGRSI